jgi:ABC-type lipoprotein release transport system permease subunit
MARAIRGLLFGVGINDWQSVAVPLAVLAVAAGVAAWVPARRASRVDPLITLRAE